VVWLKKDITIAFLKERGKQLNFSFLFNNKKEELFLRILHAFGF